MQIIDCNVVVGRSIVPGAKVVENPNELLTAMDKSEIDQALIWHIAQYDTFPESGNKLACDFVANQDRLFCSWTALPPATGEIPFNGLFDKMKAAGVFALRLFPVHHHFVLDETALYPLAHEASACKVPFILSLSRDVVWQDVYGLLKDCPNLTCILTDIGVWGQDRYFWPLLEKYPNVYIETGLLSLEAGGLACSVKQFGAERFVYGSGYPDRYFEAPLLDLLHSDISQNDRELIASGNISRIMAEVQL